MKVVILKDFHSSNSKARFSSNDEDEIAFHKMGLDLAMSLENMKK